MTTTSTTGDGESGRDVTVTLTVNFEPFIEAMARAAASIAELMKRIHIRPDGTVRAVDVHHPKPLSIDGHAYHRRRRARARRNR